MAASDSDDAFDFVLQELGAQQGIADDPQAEDSDREMDRMLEVVREGHRDHFSQRGSLLCLYMRKCKLVSSLSRQPKVAQHIQDLIDRYNKECAKTLEEVIDMSEKKRTVVRGRWGIQEVVAGRAPACLLGVEGSQAPLQEETGGAQ